MNLTMSLIKADIVAAQQAVNYYENSNLKDIKMLPLIICNKQLRN